MGADQVFLRAMALAAGCLRADAAVLAAAAAADPLRLDLPPLPAGSRDASITPASLRALAALYLQANLEDAGIVTVAELLGQILLGRKGSPSIRGVEEHECPK